MITSVCTYVRFLPKKFGASPFSHLRLSPSLRTFHFVRTHIVSISQRSPPPPPMSGALIDYVEARLGAMNQGGLHELPTIRDPASLRVPTSPQGHRRRSRHRSRSDVSKMIRCKTQSVTTLQENESITESIHENFGWLEQYVNCRLRVMNQGVSTRSLGSLSWSTHESSTIHPGHRRNLSRRDSLVDELNESLKRSPLISDMDEEDKCQVHNAMVQSPPDTF